MLLLDVVLWLIVGLDMGILEATLKPLVGYLLYASGWVGIYLVAAMVNNHVFGRMVLRPSARSSNNRQFNRFLNGRGGHAIHAERRARRASPRSLPALNILSFVSIHVFRDDIARSHLSAWLFMGLCGRSHRSGLHAAWRVA